MDSSMSIPQGHVLIDSLGAYKPGFKQHNCNDHTVNTWLTPSLLGLHQWLTHDLRSYQLNNLRINHQCHIDAPIWTYALFKPLAGYKK